MGPGGPWTRHRGEPPTSPSSRYDDQTGALVASAVHWPAWAVTLAGVGCGVLALVLAILIGLRQ